MDKRKILIQLDPDPQASVFDRVVAVDAGVDVLFAHAGVRKEQVQGLVHGAIFTRKPSDLRSTAIFVGGSDVAAGEGLMQEALKHMIPQFGLRVSILLDANGANTTAAAAVRAAASHLALAGCQALVLGATGPVGQRVVRLLAREKARVRVGSRQAARAQQVCDQVRQKIAGAQLDAVATASEQDVTTALAGCEVVIAAGAAGVVLLSKASRQKASALKVAIDLNAVPPLGIEGIEVADRGTLRDGVVAYGALGVGATKMKVHRAAVEKLFDRNDLVLDAEEIYEIAKGF